MQIIDVYRPGKETKGSYPLLSNSYKNAKQYLILTSNVYVLQKDFEDCIISNLPNQVIHDIDFKELKFWFVSWIINPTFYRLLNEKTEKVLLRILNCNIFKVQKWDNTLKWKIFQLFLDYFKKVKIEVNERLFKSEKLPF